MQHSRNLTNTNILKTSYKLQTYKLTNKTRNPKTLIHLMIMVLFHLNNKQTSKYSLKKPTPYSFKSLLLSTYTLATPFTPILHLYNPPPKTISLSPISPQPFS